MQVDKFTARDPGSSPNYNQQPYIQRVVIVNADGVQREIDVRNAPAFDSPDTDVFRHGGIFYCVDHSDEETESHVFKLTDRGFVPMNAAELDTTLQSVLAEQNSDGPKSAELKRSMQASGWDELAWITWSRSDMRQTIAAKKSPIQIRCEIRDMSKQALVVESWIAMKRRRYVLLEAETRAREEQRN